MQVKDVMSGEVHAVERRTPIADAARMMSTYDVGVLPVCDDGAVNGIVTDRDLVIRHLARNERSERVEEIMSADVLCIEADAGIEQAEALMSEHQVRRLPVCERGRIVGMVTQGDIARRADPMAVGEMVHAISERPALAP